MFELCDKLYKRLAKRLNPFGVSVDMEYRRLELRTVFHFRLPVGAESQKVRKVLGVNFTVSELDIVNWKHGADHFISEKTQELGRNVLMEFFYNLPSE